MQPDGKGRVRLDHPGPGLIGFQSDFLTMTRGTGVMSHVFDDYGPMKPEIAERRNGVLVSAEGEEAVAYALWKLQEDRKSTRLNSSHANISYAVFCLKKKKK